MGWGRTVGKPTIKSKLPKWLWRKLLPSSPHFSLNKSDLCHVESLLVILASSYLSQLLWLCIVPIQFMSSRATLVSLHSCVQWRRHLVPGEGGQGGLPAVSGGSEPPDVMPSSHLCRLCLSWTMAVSSSTDQWHQFAPHGDHFYCILTTPFSIQEMGTMAAWFGCLIMLQLLLFMSKKGASRKIVTQNDPLHTL